MEGGRPVRSKLARLISSKELASGLGSRPLDLIFVATNRSISFVPHSMAGTLGFSIRVNAQWGSYFAPCSIQRVIS